MAIRCERCGRSVQAALEVLRKGKVVEFYRCRCGSKAALMPDRSGLSTEIRRARGNLYLRMRGAKIFVGDDSGLEQPLAGVEEEFEREAAHVVVNLEEVNYLPAGCLARLETLRTRIEGAGHHLALVTNSSSMKTLIEQDAPELVKTIAENEKKAIVLVSRSE